MAHWIDIQTAELDETAAELIQVVASVLRRANEIDEFLASVRGVDLTEVPWPTGVFRARSFWTGYVPILRASGLMRCVLEAMKREFPNMGDDLDKFLTIRLATQGGWYSENDPRHAQFTGPGRSQPIFDRKRLREEIMLLHAQGYRTLNIAGPLRAGKTFSIQLVQLLAERENLQMAHIDIADWGTVPFTAMDLVTTLVTQLHVDVALTPVDAPDPNTRARLLVYQVRDVFSGRSKMRWIVVDGLDRKNVEPDATAFVERLLKSIDVDGKPTNVRLVVTGFKGQQPATSRRDTLVAVTREDVRTLLGATANQLGRAATDAQLDQWTSRAWEQYEPATHDLGDLGMTVYEIVQAELIGAGVS